MDVVEISTSFIKYCKNERQLSPNTLLAYQQDMEEFNLFFQSRKISQITGDELVSYCRHLSSVRKLAPATVKRRLASIRAMFIRLTRQGLIPSNPFNAVDLRVRLPMRLPRALHSGEMRQLMGEAQRVGGVGYITILLLFVTGARVGELAKIRLEDIDFENGSVRIFGKGSRERQVFLPNQVLIAVAREVASRKGTARCSPHLLTTDQGRPATPAYLRRHVRKLAANATVTRRVTPHMIRHTTATALIEAGVDIRFIQRLLGHQSILTTQLYTHVSDGALKSAVIGADICRQFAMQIAA